MKSHRIAPLVTAALLLAACGSAPPPPSPDFPADLVGAWSGSISVQGTSIPLVFHLQVGKATMDSPSQSAFGIAVGEQWLEGVLTLSSPSLGLRVEVRFDDARQVWKGTFQQGGLKLPLELMRVDNPVQAPKRPQQPQPPFPYSVQDVQFAGGAEGVTLSGTLTVSTQTPPRAVLVLVSGSGPNDRDETILGHKPFLLLADTLTRRGFAVLRYDKRGISQSTGNYGKATTFDFADDAEAALLWLKQRFPRQKAGMLGHSEGGLIAPLVQKQHQTLDFLVLLAGPGVPIAQLMSQQRRDIARLQGVGDDAIEQNEALQTQLTDLLFATPDDAAFVEKGLAITERLLGHPSPDVREQMRSGLQTLASPWYRAFLSIDPRPNLLAVKVPVLALNGSADSQVAAEPNLKAIQTALAEAGNRDATVQQLPGLNHLFQPSATGSPSEYGAIETTFDPGALGVICDWLESRFPGAAP